MDEVTTFQGANSSNVNLWALTISGMASAEDSKIIAIGDIHGDYEAYEAILEAANLIDTQGKWSGGKASLFKRGISPTEVLIRGKFLNILESFKNKRANKVINRNSF